MTYSTKVILLSLTCLSMLTSCHRHISQDSQTSVFDSVLTATAVDTTVHQLLLVRHTEGYWANAELYLKSPEGRWLLTDTCTAAIGREGLGKEREGDMKTPVGELRILSAFGILPDPGCQMPYLEAYPTLYACDDDPEYYNTLIDTAQVHHDCHGEHIISIDPAYHYVLTTSYNEERIFGLGCNIFVHCKGTKPYTAGCVALDTPMMRHLMQVAEPGMIVSIH